MVRKRVETVTTVPRYLGKMRRIGEAITGDPQLAMFYAISLMAAQRSGYGKYKSAWEILKKNLVEAKIASAKHGLCKAAMNEYINKVMTKKEMSPDDWRAKWAPVIGDDACDVIERTLSELPRAPQASPQAPPKG
jgi:hypothetical protein